MRKLASLTIASTMFALAGCGGGAEPADDEMVATEAAEPITEVEMMPENDGNGALTDGDDAMAPADNSGAAISADALEVEAEDTEFDPTGNPIGPGEAQD